MVGWLIGKDMEGSGRGLIWGTIVAFAWRDWGKPSKTSVRIAGLRADIWIRDLQNMKQKVKVKPSRYTPWRRMWGEEVQLLLILNLGTRWGWVESVTPRPRFPPGERTPGTHWIGGWVGPRAGLDAEARRKILCSCRGSNLDRPIVQPIVRHYTAWATAVRIWSISDNQSVTGAMTKSQ
jgi:hypothetical protein